ncbi:hypothetical protein PspLS_04152 [Pyricularia sp. CBS 133598]|nr:hypothetical protein PspLS_04152 [Pyricularia sp. CBS 133598]
MSRGQAGNLDHASQSANCHYAGATSKWVAHRTYSCFTPCAAVGAASWARKAKGYDRIGRSLNTVFGRTLCDRRTLFWEHKLSGDQMCINHSARRRSNYTRAQAGR